MRADRLGEITAPTLVIWGAEDQLIFPAAAQPLMRAYQMLMFVIYEGVGHLPMEEAPERTALDIDVFLERTVKRQRGDRAMKLSGVRKLAAPARDLADGRIPASIMIVC